MHTLIILVCTDGTKGVEDGKKVNEDGKKGVEDAKKDGAGTDHWCRVGVDHCG